MNDSTALIPTLLPFVLLNQRQNLPATSGAYFALAADGTVLYVGVTQSLRERWKQHGQLPALRLNGCTTIAYYLCPTDQLNTIEQAMVLKFHPPLNGPWKPWVGQKERIPLATRFWAKVNRHTCLGETCGCHKGIGHCWPWTGYHLPGRHGKIPVWIDGQWKKYATSRVAYELQKGPILPGFFVCHTCDNPPCCRGSHLWLGTVADNTKDAYQKGRLQVPSGVGDNHYLRKSPEKLAAFVQAHRAHARLSADDVSTILSLIGTMPYTAIGQQFHISASLVSLIYKNQRYQRQGQDVPVNRQPQRKLTDVQVDEIRRLKGTMTYKQIGERFGICAPHVCDIMNDKRRTSHGITD